MNLIQRSHYEGRYKYGKQKKRMSIDQLTALMKRVKRQRIQNQYLGVDPLRDASLLAVFYWTGLRLSEVVGDRPRSYKVSRFSREEREEMKRRGVDWKTQPNPYITRTSPERPGIRQEDIELDEEKNVLSITALALKHGERKAPLQLSLDLPYVDLIKQQWERTRSREKIWDLKREYAWEILKELDPKLYTHYFRFNRTMEFIKDPRISPPDLLSWFGWKRLQTAYNYLEVGGRRIKEMRNVMVEQYTGKKVELPEEVEVEEILVEQPKIEAKPSPKPEKPKSLRDRVWEVIGE